MTETDASVDVSVSQSTGESALATPPDQEIHLQEALQQNAIPAACGLLCERLTKIEQHLAEAAQLHAAATDALGNRVDGLAEKLADLHREIATRLAVPPPSPTVPAAECSAPTPSDDVWQQMILGNELCHLVELTDDRQELLQDVLAGRVSARALAAQLILVQTASPQLFPELLKQVGEAYYLWRPRDSDVEDRLEQALARSLTKRAEAAGLKNSIQLVRPGERFDSTRHTTTERGVEIVSVRGWIVLRESGKVYTKATVTVK